VGGALQLSGVFSLFFVSGPRNLIEATFKVAAKSWPKLDESQDQGSNLYMCEKPFDPFQFSPG